MVVSQFFSPLRTLKNKARGTKLATTSSSSPSTTTATTAGRNSDSSSDSDTPPATPMSTDTCLCCNSKVTFPATVSCFKCTVCDTINDLQPVRRTEKTVTDNREVRVRMREAPPPLTLDRLRAGVQAYRRDLAKQALLEAMLRESFGNWDVLNFSFVKANVDEPDAAEVCLEEVAAAYRIILDLPSGLIRAMMTGIELILRRPGRPLKTFSDIRYLLVILENPLLQQQTFAQEASYHHHILKSILGVLSNLPNATHNALVLHLSKHHGRSSLKRKIHLVNQFISYRVQKYDRANQRRRNMEQQKPLTAYSEQSAMSELPAFHQQRTIGSAAQGRVGGHQRMRSNTDSRVSLSSHEKGEGAPLDRAVARLALCLTDQQQPATAGGRSREGLVQGGMRGQRSCTMGAWSARDAMPPVPLLPAVPVPPRQAHVRSSPRVLLDTAPLMQESFVPRQSRHHQQQHQPCETDRAGTASAIGASRSRATSMSASDLPALLAASAAAAAVAAASVAAAAVAEEAVAEEAAAVLARPRVLAVPDRSVRVSMTRTRSSSEAPTRRAANNSAAAGIVVAQGSGGGGGARAGGITLGEYYVGADGVIYPKTSTLVMHQHDWRLVAASRTMALLHAANQLLPCRSRLPVDAFYSLGGVDNMDLVADYDAWQARVPGAFSFCQYPFLLSLRAKVQIMQVDAARQMDSKVKEAVISALFQNSLMASQPYLKLFIRRKCLVEDSLNQLATHEQDLKKRLKIEFVGEEGVDAGGLAKEWFMLLVRDLLNPLYGLFVCDAEDGKGTYWFNPAALETSNRYFLVGVVVGLALYNSTLLDLHLPLAVFKKLLYPNFYHTPQHSSSVLLPMAVVAAATAATTTAAASNGHAPADGSAAAQRYGAASNGTGGSAGFTGSASAGGMGDGRSPIYGLLSSSAQVRYQINEMLSDVGHFRPDLARGLRQLLQYRETDVEQVFSLTFEASYDAYGETITVPLIPQGAHVPVTSHNRVEYVMRYLQWVLNDSVARQFEPFKRGFYYVCGGNALSLFRPEEIELMVNGSGEDWDSKMVRKMAEQVGFEDGVLVEWVWAVLDEMKVDERRLFLLFVTGTDRLPMVSAGAAGLKLKIMFLGDDWRRLPVAHTCFNQLGVWKYRSKDEMRHKIMLAIKESEGFGLK